MIDSLGEALAVAECAAREAGALVRAEFERPQGPRGEGEYAPVNVAAKAAIRAHLLSAFPNTGFRGEQTGWGPSAGPAASDIWVVDSNDDTASFLRGMRGSAVSIALVRQGRPVLGVVVAPTWPDSNGELFAWAQGCGPVRRNGVACEPPSFPSALRPSDVVIVSQGADRAPAENAAAVAPGRFLSMPGIALRLALVAAGEAVAAVSSSGPEGREYAAGHALLLGVGGDLVDENGELVRYAADASSQVRRCFGGGLDVCRDLARRDWICAVEGGDSRDDDGVPTRLRPGSVVRDAGLLSRAQGCLLGLVSGDSLGGQVEFLSARQIAAAHPDGVADLTDGGTWRLLAGQPTDDSEMALMLARSIVAGGGPSPERSVAAYVAWLRSPAFDVGGTTRRALGAVTDPVLACGRAAVAAMTAADPDSQANGSLMRIAPLGIWGAGRTDDQTAAAARADALLTHPHPVCQEAAEVFTVAIAAAVREGLSPAATWERAVSRTRPGSPIRADLEAAVHGPPDDFMAHMGWVRVALRNAFFQLLHAPDVEHGIMATVAAGGDTDTNGAIAGALLGAVFGRAAIPARWRNLVLSCRALPGTATRYPRSRVYWPIDLLELAERLVLAGAG